MENQTDSVLKSGRDFNHQLTIPGQREEIPSLKSPQTPGIDFCEIKGQYLAKRALEIAAAGSHHTMLIGPTGSGKTMFIKALKVSRTIADLQGSDQIQRDHVQEALQYVSEEVRSKKRKKTFIFVSLRVPSWLKKTRR